MLAEWQLAPAVTGVFGVGVEASAFLVETGDGSTYLLTRWLFLRSLGVIYFIAYLSLGAQVIGLIGRNGVLPAHEYLDEIRARPGKRKYRLLPTLFWFNASDVALKVVCGTGMVAAALLIAGFAPLPMLIVLWLGYLSLTVVGQEFLSFQWDVLLVETGFLAIFLAPSGMMPVSAMTAPVSPIALGLFWWLLFRLMFESGVVKLSSGDKTWWNLTALDYHYFTQPLPTWMAWYFHHMPAWFRQGSVAAVYVIEIFLPLLIFTSSEGRIAACAGLVLLQLLILLTGNYNFFNLLSIALCVLLLDDAFWSQVLPSPLVELTNLSPGAAGVPVWHLVATLVVAAVVGPIGLVQLGRSVHPKLSTPRILNRLEWWVRPLRIVNSYGLFRVMTTERPEIIVEGSMDATEWRPYTFKYKPGDTHRRPGFVEPHQPRLDWQMWFAALSSVYSTPWFHSFLLRLLEGSCEVQALMRATPFPGKRPRYVRAVLYNYCFTTPKERKESGAWWHREPRGLYAPPVSLPDARI